MQRLESRDLFAIGFGFGVNGSPPVDGTEATVFIGQEHTIHLYLVEIDDPSESRLRSNGLLTFDLLAEYDNSFGSVTDVNVSDAFSAFRIAVSDELPSPIKSSIQMAGTDPTFVLGVEPDPGTRYVELGSFEFDARASGVTEFKILDSNTDESNNGTALGDGTFEALDMEVFTTDPFPVFRIITTVDAIDLPGGVAIVQVEGDDVLILDEQENEIARRSNVESGEIRLKGPDDIDDQLIVRSPSMILPSLRFDGGAGGNDSAKLERLPGDDPIDYLRYDFLSSRITNVVNVRDQPIGSPDFLLQLVDLEPIEDELEVVDREFNFARTDDIVTFDTGTSSGDDILRIASNNSESVDFEMHSGTIAVNLGAGSDQFVLGLPADELPMLDGQDGTDELALTGSGTNLDLTDTDSDRPTNIEVINIIGSGANSLTLDEQSVSLVTDAADTLLVEHDENDQANYLGDDWQVEAPIFVDGAQRHVLTSGDVSVEVSNTLPWQNPLQRFDTNFNGDVTSLDALQIINFLGTFLSSPVPLPDPTSEAELPERYYDVNGSRTATSLDALQIINFLATVRPGREQVLFVAPQASETPDEDDAVPFEDAQLSQQHVDRVLVQYSGNELRYAESLPVDPVDTRESQSALIDQSIGDWLRDDLP